MKKKTLFLVIYLLITTIIGSIVTITRGSTDGYSKYAIGGELVPLNLTQILSEASSYLVTFSAITIGIISIIYIIKTDRTKIN
jgi:hypothetical protein